VKLRGRARASCPVTSIACTVPTRRAASLLIAFDGSAPAEAAGLSAEPAVALDERQP
jgi:hypothetical protein